MWRKHAFLILGEGRQIGTTRPSVTCVPQKLLGFAILFSRWSQMDQRLKSDSIQPSAAAKPGYQDVDRDSQIILRTRHNADAAPQSWSTRAQLLVLRLMLSFFVLAQWKTSSRLTGDECNLIRLSSCQFSISILFTLLWLNVNNVTTMLTGDFNNVLLMFNI